MEGRTTSMAIGTMQFVKDDPHNLLSLFMRDALGKLSVPAEILEKPAKLTEEEFCVVRGHAYFTDRILYPISALEMVRVWGALHHERLDGAGYPFHLRGSDIPVGSRIMAVADVFVALMEDRPYRKGMTRDEALAVLQTQATGGALDPEVIALLNRHFDDINSARIAAQSDTSHEYLQFLEDSKLSGDACSNQPLPCVAVDNCMDAIICHG